MTNNDNVETPQRLSKKISSQAALTTRLKSLQAGQNRVLEMLAQNRGLSEVLDKLAQTFDRLERGSHCAIMTINNKSNRFRCIAAPNLPHSVQTRLENIELEKSSVSDYDSSPCLNRCYLQSETLEDAPSDPHFQALQDIADDSGMRSFRTVPISGEKGRSHGVLIAFSPSAHQPADTDMQLIDWASNLASIAIRHDELQNERNELFLAVESCADGIVLTDTDAKIRYINPAFTEITGYSEEEAMGKNPRILKSGKHPTGFYKQMWEVLLSGKSWSGRVRDRKKDGSLYHQLLLISPVRNRAGVVSSYISMQRDITKEIEREEALYEALQHAEAATKAKTSFLTNMSHEIRTPMTAILGFADNLVDTELSDEQKRDAIRIIRQNGDHLLELINDILDLSKIEAGEFTIEHIPASLVDLLVDVRALLIDRVRKKELYLDIRCVTPIPETIVSDNLRIKQILINIIGNALKFTSKGGIRVLVSFVKEEGQSTSNIHFNIHDTGTGMTPEEAINVLKPFAQADVSTTRRFGGTGLGLTISQHLAEKLGGMLEIVSTDRNVGSHFRITINVSLPDDVKMIAISDADLSQLAKAPKLYSPNSFSDLKECKVLVAEDNSVNQKLITHILKKAGASITIADNGKIASELALAAQDNEEPFDVILMDWQMPVMDGLTSTTLLREKGYTRPIVALTAHAMANHRDTCMQTGFDGFLTKPINRESLIETIQKLVAQAKQN